MKKIMNKISLRGLIVVLMCIIAISYLYSDPRSSNAEINKNKYTQTQRNNYTHTDPKEYTPMKTIEELKKNAKKYYFNWYSPKSKKGAYVQIVWKWMIKYSSNIELEGKENLKKLQEISSSTFDSTQSREFIFADFNNDKYEDFIVIPNGAYFCAGGGTHGCSSFIFLGPKYLTVIDSSDIYQSLPDKNVLYLLNSSTNGMKDFIKNNKFLCKFNGSYKVSNNKRPSKYSNMFYICK